MELRELRSFSAAARLRSISKAAEQLGLGQPTVSTHIKKLEDEIGTPLFDRVRRPIEPTPFGTELARLAIPLTEGIDELVRSAAGAETEGPVRLASTHDLISHALLRVVSVFLSEHPHNHLQIRSGVMSEVLEMVAAGDADLGLAPVPERSEDFDFLPLVASERVLITPRGHPLMDGRLTSLDQIAQWPLILRRRETATSKLLESEFERRGLSYEIRVELDSMDMVKRYVALGMGISVGPRMAIEPEDEQGLGIISLGNLLPVEPVGIITLPGKTLSTPVQAFVSVIKDTLAPTHHRRNRSRS